MKIEINNTVTESTFYKEIVQKEKKDFLKIIKKLQVDQVKKFSVYTIAAKIARGEQVSSEELTYIRENAPSLLEAAREQNAEREKTERGENSTSKKVKQTKLINVVNNNSEKAYENSTKADCDSTKVDNNISTSNNIIG